MWAYPYDLHEAPAGCKIEESDFDGSLSAIIERARQTCITLSRMDRPAILKFGPTFTT